MHYQFPEVANISDVIPFISDKEEFYINQKEHFTVVDYRVNFSDTFGNASIEVGKPYGYLYDDIIRRECRGLIFDNKTGALLRRGFHKFFNAGEKPETSIENIDLSKPHKILAKLDGSMIAPFMLEDRIYWATMAGAIDFHEEVNKFVASHLDIDYDAFVDMMFSQNGTPIFEFCSDFNRIVVGYEQPHMTLTAVRHKLTGEYLPYDELDEVASWFNIPVVEAYNGTFENMEALVTHTRAIDDSEGYVIAFDDGHRIKIKSDWYCQLHKVRSYFDYEKDIVDLLITGKIDDLLPMLTQHQRVKIEAYEHELRRHIVRDVISIQREISRILALSLSRKDFSLSTTDAANVVRNTIFRNWENLADLDQGDVFKCVEKTYVDNTLSHGRWREFKAQANMELTW